MQGQATGSPLNLTEALTTTQRAPAVAAGASGYLVAWEDARNEATTGNDIYARFLDSSGAISGTEIAVTTAADDQNYPALAYNPQADNYLVAWADYSQVATTGAEIAVQLVESDGTLGLSVPVTLTTVSGDQRYPAVAYNPDDQNYLVVWEDDRPGTSGLDIYGQVVSADGSLVGSNLALSTASNNQFDPVVAYSEAAGVYLVAWWDARAGSHWDIYGQVVSPTGVLSGSNFAIASPTGSNNNQEYPDIVARSGDSTAEFVVVWQDRRNGWNRDIYLQRVNGQGILLDEIDTGADETDPTVNVPLAVDSGAYLERPAVIYNPDEGIYLAAWNNQASGGVEVRRYSPVAPPAPTAGLSADGSGGVVPVTITFSDASTGQIADRHWNFGDGSAVASGTGYTVTHTYLTTGTFTVLYTVSNPGGADTASTLITVTEQFTPALVDDFSSYEVGKNPDFWLEQDANGLIVNQFRTLIENGNLVYGSPTSNTTTYYAAYAIPGWAAWQSYEYRGRVQRTHASGQIGLMVYSQYPALQAKRYVLHLESGSWRFNALGAGTLTGDLDTGVTLTAEAWYQFRVQAITLADRTVLRAKLWLDGTTEPAAWQAVAVDTAGGRLTAGAVGIRTRDPGSKYIDDLIVTPLNLQVDFGAGPREGSIPLTATFVATPSLAVITYTWNYGDGSPLSVTTSPTATHTYTQSGVYTVSLKVEDGVLSDTLTRTNYITATNNDPRDWQLITTTTTLNVIGEQAMVYDRGREVVVLFGGNATGWPYEDTTWEFDGDDWQVITTAQTPTTRYGAAMAYDSLQDRIYLFGGSNRDDQALNQTWIYSTNTWIELNPMTSPFSRTYAAITSDPISGTIYLFGGNDGETYFDDLWRFDGVDWQVITSTGQTPPARTLAAIAYDANDSQLYLFGGRSLTGTVLADLWAFDPATTDWTLLDEGGGSSPPGRQAHALAYDEARGMLVLVGGATTDGETILADTWHYQDGWQEASPTTTLPPQAYHQLIYDSAQDRLILVGGGEVWGYE